MPSGNPESSKVPLKILVVDDDDVDRMAIERFVREQGLPYEITTSPSVAQGRGHLQRTRFDVAILDYLLSDGTGLDLLSELKSTPCIILTGSGNEFVAAQALRQGAYDYLIKDSDRDYLGLLAATVENAIRRKQVEVDLREANERLQQRVAAQTAELRASNEALSASETKYLQLYDNAPDMMASIDANSGQITRCNQTLAATLGYATEEIVGLPILDLYHPDCSQAVQAALDSFLQTGEVHDAELQLKRKDGSKIEVSLNVSGIRDEEGRILFSSSIWRDVTERQRAKSALQRARDELESRVEERTAELSRTNAQLEAFNKLAIGREARMIELKREVNELSVQAGLEPPYDLSFVIAE